MSTQANTRPRLAFHCDGCDASISLNLGDDDYEGGDLLLFADGQLRAAPRSRGAAAAHLADVAHGVTEVTRGTRWSLVVFCHRTRKWRSSARILENDTV